MIKISLALAKILRSKKLLKGLNKNIYNEIKYPKNRIMIIDDHLDFNMMNNLLNLVNVNYLSFKLDDDILDEIILNNFDNYGYSNKDFFFFQVTPRNIKKYGSILKPNYILINESSCLIDKLETKDIFENATIIHSDKYDFNGISYSLKSKSNYYISNIDYIKEKITINKEYDININDTKEEYLKEILMFFALFKTIDFNIDIFNQLNLKNFTYEDKKIYIDIENNNYNNAIKFISRYSDYKVLVIGWKINYDDISWLYNIEFERLVNKNIQKIYCIGNNAYDIATRLKYADLSEKNIIASSNIDVVLKEINNYNLNLYILMDKYYLNIIKGA